MRTPPLWITNLPPGKYDSAQLKAITGLTAATIGSVLKRYGAIIKKVPSGYKNLQKNIFIWEGVKKKE